MSDVYGIKLFGFQVGMDIDKATSILKDIAVKFDEPYQIKKLSNDDNTLIELLVEADNYTDKYIPLCQLYFDEDNDLEVYILTPRLFDYPADKKFRRELCLQFNILEDELIEHGNKFTYSNYQDGWEIEIELFNGKHFEESYEVVVRSIDIMEGPRFSL